MKILTHTYGYPPIHNAGSESTMHAASLWLTRRGHEVRNYSAHNAVDGSMTDGIPVRCNMPWEVRRELYDWADIVLTHLHVTRDAIGASRLMRRPLVHFIHNPSQLAHHAVHPERDASAVVFNTYWIQRRQAWPGALQCVVNPPLNTARFMGVSAAALDNVRPYFTLVNLDSNKGPALVWEVARTLPDVPFLAVRGSYGRQWDEVEPPPANVTVIPNTPDIVRDVYARTRVLLMPSREESWGRTAMEAAVLGIPTLANPTAGLEECLRSAGVFVPRYARWTWARAVESMLDDERVKELGWLARIRADAFLDENEVQMLGMERMLFSAVARPPLPSVVGGVSEGTVTAPKGHKVIPPTAVRPRRRKRLIVVPHLSDAHQPAVVKAAAAGGGKLPVTVACVLRSGGDYTVTDVERLWAGVTRGMGGHPHRFVCFSDVPVPCERVPLMYGWPGWWSKMELFRPRVFTPTDVVLYLDLDVVVTGRLTGLFTHIPGQHNRYFAALRDWLKPDIYNSTVMVWRGDYTGMLDAWREDAPVVLPRYYTSRGARRPGDQEFITDYLTGHMRMHPAVVQRQINALSFKVHHVQDGLPPETDLVCFHGQPRPAAVAHLPWMREFYGRA